MSIQTEVDIYSLCLIHHLWREREADRLISIPFVFPKELNSRDEFVFSGLSAVKEHIRSYRLTIGRIKLLRGLPILKAFSSQFWDFAMQIRFKGKIRSLKDGDIFRKAEIFFELEGPAAQVFLYRQGAKTILTYETSIATFATGVKNAAGSKRVTDLAAVRAPDLFTCLRHLGGIQTAGFDIPSLNESLTKYVVTVLAGGVESKKLFHPACFDRIQTLATRRSLNFRVNLSDV